MVAVELDPRMVSRWLVVCLRGCYCKAVGRASGGKQWADGWLVVELKAR